MSVRQSFAFAWTGVRHILANERNARIHVAVALLAIVAGIVLQLSAEELSAVVFAIMAVFLAEIFNSAIEKTLDIVEPGHHEQVKLVKDMAAGAVLVAAVGAVLIGLIVFGPHLWETFWPAQ